jgi:hypothetical protein
MLLAGSFAGTAGTAGAQERARDDVRGDVPTVVREPADPASHAPLPWEVTGFAFPTLAHLATVTATSEDSAQLVFLDGTELGSFRPAPIGGTPFFGSGQPIFGLAAPPVLPTRVLRALGEGDAGDSFLGARPPVDPVTLIPKFRETFDQSRESFAFLGGIPPIPDPGRSGSTAFPLPEVVEADDTPGCLDNDPTCRPLEPPAGRDTPPTTVQRPPTVAPGPNPGPTEPPVTPPPTSAPPTLAPPPTGTPTTAPPPTTPSTTAPPVGTTTTVRPTTTTMAPTTTTTVRPTTTTTRPTTTTTRPPTTTTTTTTPPAPPPPTPSAAFVLANRVRPGTDDSDSLSTADFCLSNDVTSNRNEGCDDLFRFGSREDGRDGFMELDTEYPVNLTLWNIPAESDLDAVTLRGYARNACTSTPTAASSAESLCRAIMLKVERFSSPTRSDTSLVQCVYGDDSGGGCGWDHGKTLHSFGAAHAWPSGGVTLEDPDGFPLGRKAYLRITVKIRDTGTNADGTGRDNHLIGQQANLVFRWEMTSG